VSSLALLVVLLHAAGAPATAPRAADATAAAPGRVVVESATTCPTAAEVEERLRVLLPPLGDGAAPERATLSAEAGALRVRLAAADGAPIAERTVTVAASCADRANVVAVVIAAWDVQQRAERVDDPSLPHAPRAAPPPSPPAVVAAAPSPPRAAGPRLEVALGPAVTFVDGGVAPTGALTAALWGRRLGGRLGAFGLLPRGEALGAGEARWTRVGATLEAGLRATGRFGRLDGHAGLVLGAVVASGQGFDLDHQTGGLSPGALAGADWSYVFGRLFAGAGASLSAWTEQHLVFQSSPVAARGLPRLQPAVGVHVGAIF